jgi:hypothetical protein
MSIAVSDLAAVVAGTDPVGAALRIDRADGPVVTWSRAPSPESWLVDDKDEGSIDSHRGAHAQERPSEALVVYGDARTPDAVAARLIALGELAEETGLLRAITLRPEGGGAARPASWGYEDLSVVAAARLAAPRVAWIRPDWRALGRHACQVAVSFGATDWLIPHDDPADPELLALAIGVTAVAR